MRATSLVVVGLLCAVFCLVPASAQPLPGLKVTLQQTFINELTSTFTPIIEGFVLDSNLPDFSGVEHIPLAGKVDWTISDIHMDSLDFTQDTLSVIPGVGLEFKVTDGNGQFTCNWEWKRESGIIHPSDHGSATVSFSKVSMDLKLDIGENGGRPTVYAPSFSFDLGKLSISVHGWTGWVYDFFLWLFNSIVKKQVESYIVSGVTTIINVNVSSALQSLPTVVPVWSNGTETLGLDISLTSGINFAGPYVTTPFLGGIELNNQLPLFWPTVSMPDNCSSTDLNVLFNDYIFQSSSQALFQSGLLQVTLSPENVPPSLEYVLNTTFWQFIIPNLYKHYPNTLVNVTFAVSSTPYVAVTSNGFYGNITYDINIYVPDTQGSALTIGGNSETQFLLFLTEQPADGNVLHVNVSLIDTKLSVLNSNVGYVNLLLLNQGIAIILNDIIIPLMNRSLGQYGIPLPSIEKLILVDPNFFYFEGFACMQSNVLFNSTINPSASSFVGTFNAASGQSNVRIV